MGGFQKEGTLNIDQIVGFVYSKDPYKVPLISETPLHCQRSKSIVSRASTTLPRGNVFSTLSVGCVTSHCEQVNCRSLSLSVRAGLNMNAHLLLSACLPLVTCASYIIFMRPGT